MNSAILFEKTSYNLTAMSYCHSMALLQFSSSLTSISKVLPIFDIQHCSKIKNLINLENNLLALIDDNNINIYKYNIENKTSEIIIKSDIKTNNIKLIKRKNRNSISSYNNGFFNIYEIPSLTLENSIEIKKGYVQTIIYEQISYNEIIFALNNYIYTLNIENNPNNIFFQKK